MSGITGRAERVSSGAKIVDVTAESYSWPRAKPIRTGRHWYSDMGVDVVRVRSDDGLEGTGISLAFRGGGPFYPTAVEILKPAVIGSDPLDRERIWDAMYQPKLVGRRGLVTRVISVIDIAVWDLVGKMLEQPVYKLLGAHKSRVEAYIAGGYYEEGKGLRELAQEMEENLRLGARAVKMKVGALSIKDDAERVRVVRETVGLETKLMVDANNAYRAHEAILFARAVERHEPYWFEEPVLPDDYQGHARVAASTVIPIATGENEYTRYGFRDLIEHKAAAILQPDAQVCGGVTEWVRIAGLAHAYELPVAPHGSQDVHVHLVAAAPNGLICEYYRDTFDPMWGRIFREKLALTDGYVAPPDRPGFGWELDMGVLGPLRVA